MLNSGDASGNLVSSPVWLDQIYGIALQAVFTGSPTGTVKLQGSVDQGPSNAALTSNPALASSITWNDISGSSQAVTGAGTVTWNFNGVFYKWVRVSYTASSGTGTLTVTINAKG